MLLFGLQEQTLLRGIYQDSKLTFDIEEVVLFLVEPQPQLVHLHCYVTLTSVKHRTTLHTPYLQYQLSPPTTQLTLS